MILNLHLTIGLHSRIIFGQINFNSSRNKFDLFMNIIKSEIDIATILETEIDGKVYGISVYMSGYQTPFRLGRVSQWGEML